jgi:hypothetical protein
MGNQRMPGDYQMKYSQRWIFYTLVVIGFILSSCSAGPKAPPKEVPAVVETDETSKTKRVKLSEKASARLGIKLDVVRESIVSRSRLVGGKVVDPQSLPSGGGLIPVTGAIGQYISVRLSKSDLSLLDKTQPAQVSASSLAGADLLAETVGYENAVDDINTPLYFRVEGSGLAAGQSVYVKYHLSGHGTTQRSIPYAAILYDLKGDTWIYTSPNPLVFVRQQVVVDYIDGDRVILKDGPPVGTQIVIVGVPELYGIDTGVDK